MSDLSVRKTAARACPFCEIVAGRAPGVLRREWDDAIALVPLNPVTPGHTLIVPKAHVANYAEDPDVTSAVMRRAAEYAPAGASNLITSLGPAATQTVQHLHVHVVPRKTGDGLPLPWDRDAALAAVADHDGLAEVLRKHVHSFDESDWHIDYGCRCGERYSRSGLDWGQEPCHDEHAAHLADVVRAWLRGEP
jgi:histidine triad (HIT) family protein